MTTEWVPFVPDHIVRAVGSATPPPPTVYYKMRGEDDGETPGTSTYFVFWTAVGAPDFLGTGFSGGQHSDGTPPTGALVVGSAVVMGTLTQ